MQSLCILLQEFAIISGNRHLQLSLHLLLYEMLALAFSYIIYFTLFKLTLEFLIAIKQVVQVVLAEFCRALHQPLHVLIVFKLPFGLFLEARTFII